MVLNSRPVRRALALASLGWLAWLLTSNAAMAVAPFDLEVLAGEHDRGNVPVSFPLPEALAGVTDFELSRADSGAKIDIQFDPHTGRLVFLLREKLAAGESRSYQLRAIGKEPRNLPKRVTCRDRRRVLEMKVGERVVLHYNQYPVQAPDREQSFYDRSGYIHPLQSPAGTVVTGDFAVDHPHQHGVMFAWTKCTFQDRPLNFWDQKSRTGRIEHVRSEATISGPVFARFLAHLRHQDLTGPDGPQTVLHETWAVTLYNLPERFLIDLVSTQQAAGDDPLVVKQYHYGGFAIRGPAEWLQPEVSDFLTSAGLTRKDGNHSRPEWVDLHGASGETQAGVTLFCHPQNFRAPQPVRLHPAKPYFSWSPAVLGEFEITREKPYTSAYRLSVYDGAPDAELARRQQADYVSPPEVRVQPTK